jgi:sugar-specific transcriptional regulator TrmB
MDDAELVETLRDAGLSPYQAQAYVALLGRGSLSAQDLAGASDVPGPRIYDVLDGLESKGFVVTYERDQLYAEAVDPTAGAASIERRIERFRDALMEIEARWQEPESTPVDIGVVKRFETVLEHARDRILAADQQVSLALSYEQFLALEPALRAVHRGGVSIQVALHSTDGESLDESVFTGSATEVRLSGVRCTYQPFLAIVDGRTVSFAPFGRGRRGTSGESEATATYGVLVDDPAHAYVFEWYFLAALWDPAERLFAHRHTDLPVEFVDVREVVRAVGPLLRKEATVTATIVGRRVSSGRRVTVSGEVVSVASDRSRSTDDTPLQSLSTQRATLVLDTDDGTVSVGGKGAYDEDIEAERLSITALDGATVSELTGR